MLQDLAYYVGSVAAPTPSRATLTLFYHSKGSLALTVSWQTQSHLLIHILPLPCQNPSGLACHNRLISLTLAWKSN